MFNIMTTVCDDSGCQYAGCVNCVTKYTSLATIEDTEPKDRVARAKRHLEQSTERVKKTRIQARADQLRMEYLLSKERLDQCVLAIAQAEDVMDTGNKLKDEGRRANMKRMLDKRQLLLMKVVEAEEAILDVQDDE
ncbi:MAG: hypothetical protein EHM22_00705 [Actinobacteria bacterium]|nr:MAG: hypothetical protein EHM22_00705 [Actinomycetota bacterium]